MYKFTNLVAVIPTPITNLVVNTVIVSKEDKAIIFDPAKEFEEIKKAVDGKQVVAIILTHAHWDHVYTLRECLAEFNCPVYMHENAPKLFHDSYLNGAYTHTLDFKYEYPKDVETHFLTEQHGFLKVSGFEFEYYYTPGHSDDSMIYMIQNNIVAGDTIRKHKLARTDLPTSSVEDLEKSNLFIKTLNPDFMVYNGHDEPDFLKNFYLFQNK